MKIISEKKLKAVMRNLEKAHAAQITHGYYLHTSQPVDRWPPDMRRMYQQRFQSLIELPHIDSTKDAGIIGQVTRFEVLIAKLYSYLMQNSIVDESGGPAPILKVLGSYEGGLRRAYSEAGLTPQSRKMMRLETGPGSLAVMLSSEVEENHED